jgi:hypothetical protein
MRKIWIIWVLIMMVIPSASFAIFPHFPIRIYFTYADPGFTDNSFWLISPLWPSYVIGEVGFPSPTGSRWHIAQWGIDPNNPLPPITSGNRVFWQVRTRDAKVQVSRYGKQRMVTLWHSTEDPYYDQNQICHDPNTFYPSAEFDLLILPNMTNDPDLPNSPNLPQNFLGYDATPPLSQIKDLYLQVQQRLVDVGISYRCGYDSAVTLLAVVFINPVTEPAQKLYYHITTFDTRWPNQNTDGWFYNGDIFEGIANYGYDDSITNGYNLLPLVRHSGWRNFSLDIRDRVTYLIETSTNSIDKDLSHWKVYFMYAGSAIFGKGHIQSQLKGINLLRHY